MNSARRPPRRHAVFDPVQSLDNFAILPSCACCWCGVTPGVFSLLDCLPRAEGPLPSAPLFFRRMILQQRVVWGLPMRFKSELTIRAAWRIVASGLEQWAQTGSIEPEHLATVRTVQIGIAQYLAKLRGRAGRPVHGMEYAPPPAPYRADSERPDLLERATRIALCICC